RRSPRSASFAAASPGVTAAAGPGRCRRIVLSIGHPDVPLAIDDDPVRENHHPFAETLHQLAARIELHDRGKRRHLPRRAVETAVGAAPFGHPDRLAVLVDLDGAGRAPAPTFRQLEMVFD